MEKSITLRNIKADGNCMFRALSDQMTFNQSLHIIYRQQICDFLRNNQNIFIPFIAGLSTENNCNIIDYINDMEKPGTYGDNACLVAFSMLKNVRIIIYSVSSTFSIIGQHHLNTIQLLLHNVHYYSVQRDKNIIENENYVII